MFEITTGDKSDMEPFEDKWPLKLTKHSENSISNRHFRKRIFCSSFFEVKTFFKTGFMSVEVIMKEKVL